MDFRLRCDGHPNTLTHPGQSRRDALPFFTMPEPALFSHQVKSGISGVPIISAIRSCELRTVTNSMKQIHCFFPTVRLQDLIDLARDGNRSAGKAVMEPAAAIEAQEPPAAEVRFQKDYGARSARMQQMRARKIGAFTNERVQNWSALMMIAPRSQAAFYTLLLSTLERVFFRDDNRRCPGKCFELHASGG
jgi:hypothetical protein